MEKSSEFKAVIKSVDMSEEMQEAAIECATEAIEKFTIEKDIATHIKKHFDQNYGLTWHCVAGRSFGSFVTHGFNLCTAAVCGACGISVVSSVAPVRFGGVQIFITIGGLNLLVA